MDQAHIRGLATGISSLVAGLPRSWHGDHAIGAHKKISRIPLIAPDAALPIISGGVELAVGLPPIDGFRALIQQTASGGETWRPMSQTKPANSRAIAAQVLF
jgi:hypothetical protein